MLEPRAEPARWRQARYLPSDDLADLVEHYWTVAWDLVGREPHRQETLPHPSFHLVFEGEDARVYGVVTRKFARRLADRGRVVAAKFRPGAFRPFLGAPACTLADRTIPAVELFGPDATAAARALERLDDGAALAAVEEFVRRHRPPRDESAALASRIVEQIAVDRTALSVAQVARRADLSVRALQRLFREYVGVGPKWVVKRYRLHEAVERAGGESVDWPGLARELGYVDQAHFIRDFKSVVGRPPAAYRRAAAPPPGPAERRRP